MKVLSVDPGAKRVGLARGESDPGIAFPYRLLSCSDVTEAAQEIQNVVQEEDMDRVLLGWPLNFDSQKTEQTEAVETLYAALTERLSIPVEKVDERLTSKRARQNRREGGTSSIDVESARVLLEDWFQARGRESA